MNSTEFVKNPHSTSSGRTEALFGDKHWEEVGHQLHWFKPWTQVKDVSFKRRVSIKWFLGGVTNPSYNCLDRHLPEHAQKIALFWEPDHPEQVARKLTYQDLFDETCRMANVMKSHGVKKGDRVTVYMPMVPEALVAMLACARIGAVHSVVFGGFSPDALVGRIQDCESSFVITANEGRRGGKTIPLKKNVDEAVAQCASVQKVLVIQVTEADVPMRAERDLIWNDERMKVSAVCPCEPLDSEDPLFILYTSGSTGKPKGVLHTVGGYQAYAAWTFKTVFDYKHSDIYWCTADVGWITGHSYMVYGPLAHAATTVVFEGIPSYPTVSRFWEVIDKYQVSIFYTAPTALRALMREGDSFVKSTSRKSLRVLGSVGEPINPEAWRWYFEVVGEGQCPIVDTWWQTETGGVLIAPPVLGSGFKPGSAMSPLPGIQPALLTPEGAKIEGPGEGVLVLTESWPGQMRTVFRDHQRFEETYFSAYPGFYFTGDGCRRDLDGHYWITGRVDDVLNVSGHRLGTAEIESALVLHPAVAEAAAVGFPHPIKGQGLYVYVTLKSGVTPTEGLREELKKHVAQHLSPIAKPDLLQWAPGLPKTRSGKIMRRILRKIAENQIDQMGDTSTLADPQVVQDLVQNRQGL